MRITGGFSCIPDEATKVIGLQQVQSACCTNLNEEGEEEQQQQCYSPCILNVDTYVMLTISNGMNGQGRHLGVMGLRWGNGARDGGLYTWGMWTCGDLATAERNQPLFSHSI